MPERLPGAIRSGPHWRRPARKDGSVTNPTPAEMIASLRRLPAGAALLERLGLSTRVHLVGGAVRDLLLEREPPDLDLVLEGDALGLALRIDPDARRHGRFGTATFMVNGFVFDIARARRETYSRPGALPEIEPAGLREDLLRRDFTVNAIAMPLGDGRAGELIAAPNALADLSARQLRVFHDASFVDDPTRLLRLARYASRLRFAVEQHTHELAARAIAEGALSTVSGPRIGAELRLLAREPDPIASLSELTRLGIAEAIHPAFGLQDADGARRALDLLPAEGRGELLLLAMAAERMPRGELAEWLDVLGFEAAERELTVAAATRARALAEALSNAIAPSEIAQAVQGAPPELVAIAGSLGPAEQARSWLERLRHVRPDIDGDDLRAAGIPEGPAIGRALRAALVAKLDESATDREAQLACALQAAKATG